MKRNQRWIAIILFFSVVVGLLPTGFASAAESPVLDQEQAVAVGNVLVNRDYPRYQTFTPAISGNLNKVELNIFDYYASTGAIRLSIYKEGDLGTPLAAAEVASYSPGWVAIDFSGASPYLKKNTMYRMVASTENGGASAGFGWYGSANDPYKRGRSAAPGYDFSFRTYMVADYSLSLEESGISPAQSSLAADGASQTTVSVKLKDAQGNALTTGGKAVAITSTLGTVGLVTDNNDGTYTATLTAPTTVGTATISATVDGSPIASTASVQFVPGAASVATSTVEVGSASLAADGASQTTVSVKLKDAQGNALTIGGAAVAITSTLGTVGAVTDERNGIYTATLTSQTTPGTATISAVVDGSPIASTASVQFVPGAPSAATSTVEVGSASLAADGASQTTVSVKLKDANGNALRSGGETVAITSTLGTISTVTDMQNGTYTATLTAPTTVGTATISASIGGSAIASTASVQFVPGAASIATSTVEAGNASLAADGASQTTVSVKLKDAQGNALRNGGETVEITSTLGTVGLVRDNNDGTYTATLTAPTTVGTATISATVDGNVITSTSTVQFVPGAASVATSTIEVGSASLVADGASQTTVSVKLKDAQGNALRSGGETVVITSTLGTISAVTDMQNGTYTATLTAPTTIGTATISATVDGSPIASTTSVQFVPGAASIATSTVEAGNASLVADGTSQTTVSVKLKDANGNALRSGGEAVEITSTLGTVGLLRDNNDGTYTATLTAPTTAGTATISASIGGSKLAAIVTVTMQPAPTYMIQALPDLTLKELTAGYSAGEQQTKAVTLTRSGTGDLNNLAVSLDGTNKNYFTISTLGSTKLNDTIPSTTFTVTPKAGLSAGTYTTMVIVTADNMTPISFSVTQVVNAAAPAKLSSLRVSQGILTPTFSPDISNYAVNLGNGVTSINVTADLADSKSAMTINGNPFTSGIASTVDLDVGTNTIRIELTAADGATKSFYTISVKRGAYIPPSYYPVTSVTMSKSEVTLTAGGATETLTATIMPDYATNKQVTWRSSNPTVAQVDQNGVVTPLTEGTATITVTTADQTKTDLCQVTVLSKADEVTGIKVSEKNVVLKPKQSLQLHIMAVYTSGETKEITTDKKTKYSSSATKIATVKEGRITAGNKEGTATITIRYLDKTVQIPVTVSKLDVRELTTPKPSVQIELKASMQLSVTAVLSNGKKKDVTNSVFWSSDNEKVATVSENGKVNAVGTGTAVITATYGGKSVTVEVKVFDLKTIKKLTASQKKVILDNGKEQQIELTATLMDGSEQSVTEEAEWSTTNENIAIVKNGLITAVSAGKATIKAKYKGKTITISVRVP
ncbi:invasin domain 3-containing protein [Brevibacillus ginsengisoli]|uniref:invasin domain 3-containing protein n=1 Tax=Brevibacillus ginsengisoli TaxID=363854 RepID=UPI003CF2356C